MQHGDRRVRPRHLHHHPSRRHPRRDRRPRNRPRPARWALHARRVGGDQPRHPGGLGGRVTITSASGAVTGKYAGWATLAADPNVITYHVAGPVPAAPAFLPGHRLAHVRRSGEPGHRPAVRPRDRLDRRAGRGRTGHHPHAMTPLGSPACQLWRPPAGTSDAGREPDALAGPILSNAGTQVDDSSSLFLRLKSWLLGQCVATGFHYRLVLLRGEARRNRHKEDSSGYPAKSRMYSPTSAARRCGQSASSSRWDSLERFLARPSTLRPLEVHPIPKCSLGMSPPL